MNYKSLTLVTLFVVFILGSCADQKTVQLTDYFTKGIIDSNNLEQGIWKFYETDNNKLNQQGDFLNGLRVGWWYYYSDFKDSIFWLPFRSSDSTFATNIPGFLATEVEEPGFIAFKHKDSSKTFKLKFGFRNYVSFNLKTYNGLVAKEVAKNSIRISSKKYSMIKTTCGDEFHFNQFSGVDSTNTEYVLWTINRIQNDSLIEVTVRCELDAFLLGEQVFNSVISNLFINGSRFLDKNINCELMKNNDFKSKSKFFFGCN